MRLKTDLVLKVLIALVCVVFATALEGAEAVLVSTLAGGVFGDGAGESVKFYFPGGVAFDGSGNTFVADTANHRIRRISTTGGVTTLAGGGYVGFADGVNSTALFSSPGGVAADAAGNVYVADTGNHAIRKITPGGVVTTLAGSGVSGYADGTGAAAQFASPRGVAVDGAGTVYVADTGNHRIRRVSPAGRSRSWRATSRGASPMAPAPARCFQARRDWRSIAPARSTSPT